MKRMEYARSLGLAKAGPGRPSRAALDAIEEARKGGMVFDDDVVSTPTVKTPKAVTVKRTPGPVVAHDRQDSVIGDVTLRYPLGTEFVGYDSTGKRHVVSGRNACTCGYSLVGHTCDNPTALIGSPLERISVTPKKG